LAFRWRPAYALAAAALLVAVLVGTRFFGGNSSTLVATGQQVLVQFRLEAPDADQVNLAGDFTEWKPAHSLRKSSGGVWTVVVPLDPGVHDYAFVVDGQRWIPDPLAPAVADGFGGMNSRLAVLTPDTR
jgi:1,4-alpha-glucan branching enzyme